jgi:2-methoxy-6-polyprenyl-1,4-benzoquinol methylase
MVSRLALRPLVRSVKLQFPRSQAQRCFSSTIRKADSPVKSTNHEKTTHFGFETVPEAEKEARGKISQIEASYAGLIAFLVAGVFSNVAASYDTMNDFMSLGIHRLWKSVLLFNPLSANSHSQSNPETTSSAASTPDPPRKAGPCST